MRTTTLSDALTVQAADVPGGRRAAFEGGAVALWTHRGTSRAGPVNVFFPAARAADVATILIQAGWRRFRGSRRFVVVWDGERRVLRQDYDLQAPGGGRFGRRQHVRLFEARFGVVAQAHDERWRARRFWTHQVTSQDAGRQRVLADWPGKVRWWLAGSTGRDHDGRIAVCT